MTKFKLDLEIIKLNILSKIYDNLKNVITIVLKWFSFDLAWWPSFLTPSDPVSDLT